MKAGRGGRCRQRSSWGAPKSPFGKSSSYKPVSYVEECERVSGLLHLAELVAAVCQGSDWKGWGVHDGTSSAESPVRARESMGMPCGTQQDSWMSIWIGRGWRRKVAAGVCCCWCWVWARRGKRRALKQADSVLGARKADLCRNIPRLFSVPPLEKKLCTFIDFCSRQKVVVWNRDGFPSSVIRAWGSRILSGLSLSSPCSAWWQCGREEARVIYEVVKPFSTSPPLLVFLPVSPEHTHSFLLLLLKPLLLLAVCQRWAQKSPVGISSIPFRPRLWASLTMFAVAIYFLPYLLYLHCA